MEGLLEPVLHRAIVIELARMARMSPKDCESPSFHSIPLERFIPFYQDATFRIRGIPLDQKPRFRRDMHLLLRLLTGAHTVGEAAQWVADFGGTAWPDMVKNEVVWEDNRLHVTIALTSGLGSTVGPAEVQSVATLISLLNWASGWQLEDARGHFPVPAPMRVNWVDALFPFPRAFGCERLSVSICARDAQKPVLASSDDVLAFAEAQLSATLTGRGITVTFEEQVARLIRHNLNIKHQLISLEGAAQTLAHPASTIRRNLREEGTSFRRVRDRVVNEAARSWLQFSAASVEDISAKLGFSEVSSFRRYFCRLNGVSAARYRQLSMMEHRPLL